MKLKKSCSVEMIQRTEDWLKYSATNHFNLKHRWSSSEKWRPLRQKLFHGFSGLLFLNIIELILQLLSKRCYCFFSASCVIWLFMTSNLSRLHPTFSVSCEPLMNWKNHSLLKIKMFLLSANFRSWSGIREWMNPHKYQISSQARGEWKIKIQKQNSFSFKFRVSLEQFSPAPIISLAMLFAVNLIIFCAREENNEQEKKNFSCFNKVILLCATNLWKIIIKMRNIFPFLSVFRILSQSPDHARMK